MTTITIEKSIDNLCMEMQERRIVELHDTIKERDDNIARLIKTIKQYYYK